MSSQSDSLKSALEAVEQGRYEEAIAVLEMYEQLSLNSRSEQYLQVRKGLIECYFQTGKQEKAIWICQQLIASNNSEVQTWAQEKLKILCPEELEASLSPQKELQEIGDRDGQGFLKLKRLGDFKKYYKENLLEELKKFEQGRQQAIRAIVVSSVIAIGIVSSVAVGVGKLSKDIQKNIASNPVNYSQQYDSVDNIITRRSHRRMMRHYWNLIFFGLAIIFIILMCWVAFYSSCIDVYSREFKTKIIQKIIYFIDSEKLFKYLENTLLEENFKTKLAFSQSQLFPNGSLVSYLRQSDYVWGTIDKTTLSFSDIYAATETENYNPFSEIANSNNQTLFATKPTLIFFMLTNLHRILFYIGSRLVSGQKIDSRDLNDEILNQVNRTLVFKGLFFQANFNKNIAGKTILASNKNKSKTTYLKPDNSQLVKLEDPEFNRLFTVYSDDQVEARYILSTNLMSRLVEFGKKTKKEIYISFVENKIHIAIKCDRDLFEPRLFQSMLSFAPLQDYFENLQLMLGIVEDLNLNRRIWGTN